MKQWLLGNCRCELLAEAEAELMGLMASGKREPQKSEKEACAEGKSENSLSVFVCVWCCVCGILVCRSMVVDVWMSDSNP